MVEDEGGAGFESSRFIIARGLEVDGCLAARAAAEYGWFMAAARQSPWQPS